MRNFAAAVLGSLGLFACDSNDDQAAAQVACELSVRASAMEVARCGGNYQEAYSNYSFTARCSSVMKVRDLHGFYAVCLPFMEHQSCQDLVNAKDDPTCVGQFSY